MRAYLIAFGCLIGASMDVHASTDDPCCPVIELRQYTLKAGQRDVLIDLFDRHFVESQEAVGMTIVGQFRDRDRPDRFVWIRGFPDMTSRHRALEAFYTGPVWSAHRTAANGTMLDSTDVRLLRPARPDTALRLSDRGPGSADKPATVLVGIYTLSTSPDDALVSRFERDVVPRLQAQRIELDGVFVTETAANTFTRLPVREGEHVLMWVGTVRGRDLTRTEVDGIAKMSVLSGTSEAPSVLHLEPTSRSRLGGGTHAARATKHDFDFLDGSWTVHNRYLKERLKHSTEWAEFEAQSQVEPLLDGFGQLDRYRAVRDGATIEGLTLRLFDPATGDWSLHWADSVRAHVLLPPMIGRFTGDLGEFFGEETVDGRKVLCRFHWTRTITGSPRWEQAFSDDGGKTWETNWVMTFTRR